MKKFTFLILFFLTSTASAEVDQHLEKLSQKISALEKESQELRAQVAELKKAKKEEFPRVVSSTAAVWEPSVLDLAGLISSLPAYNLDLGLLKQKQHFTPVLQPKELIEISGKIEIQLYASREDDTVRYSDADVSTVEFDVAGYVNPWLTGFISLGYRNDFVAPPIPRRLEAEQAFVTLGNLSLSPFYATVGKRFLAFGQYNTYLSSTVLTRLLGRTNADQISVNYQHPGNTGIYATLYAFQGHQRRSGWGSAIGFAFENDRIATDVGVDYISNLGDSEGVRFFLRHSPTPLLKTVPAIAIHAQAEINAYTIIAEYVGALTPFDPRNLAYNNQGAKPQAFNFEINYAFNSKHELAVGYARSRDLVSLFFPQQRFSTIYTYTFTRNLTFSLEYRHDQSYAQKKFANAFTGHVVYYF